MNTFTVVSLLLLLSISYINTSPVWSPEPLHACPSIPPQKNLLLEQVSGDWRLAYLFLGQVDEGLNEDDTCVVTSLLPSGGGDSHMELSLFVDALRHDHVDRSAVQFSADVISPGEWKIYTPLSSGGFFHARVIRASQDHLVVTFCSHQSEHPADSSASEGDNDIHSHSSKDPLNWKTFFDESRRRKRSVEPPRSTQSEDNRGFSEAKTFFDESSRRKRSLPMEPRIKRSGIFQDSKDPLNWKTFSDESSRRKRSLPMEPRIKRSGIFQGFSEAETPGEMHMWTAVLVKHNDISALKFVEYAAVLMKHGYDVTQGELVSFGRCPVNRPHNKTTGNDVL